MSSLSVVDHDERIAFVNHIAGSDHDLGDGPGDFGEHRYLHLHRLQHGDSVLWTDPLARLDLDRQHVGDQFGDNYMTHGPNSRGTVKLWRVNTGARKADHSAVSSAFAETFVTESEGGLQARRRAAELGLESISTGVAAVLTLLARAVWARNAVEVGTGTGVSANALLAGMASDGVLTSIDSEADNQITAREVLTAQGVPQRRVRLIAGQALVVLPKLTDGAYDLVFIDGDPLEYPEYVAQAERLLRPGGILAMHHALWRGLVADERNSDDEPLIIREALDAIVANEAFTPALLPLGDGLLIAVRG